MADQVRSRGSDNQGIIAKIEAMYEGIVDAIARGQQPSFLLKSLRGRNEADQMPILSSGQRIRFPGKSVASGCSFGMKC